MPKGRNIGSYDELPYTPGKSKTVPIPNYVPGTSRATTMPYRPPSVRDDLTRALATWAKNKGSGWSGMQEALRKGRKG